MYLSPHGRGPQWPLTKARAFQLLNLRLSDALSLDVAAGMKELENRTAILQGGIIQNIYIIKYNNKSGVMKLLKGMTETWERPVGKFGQKCVSVFHDFLV